MLRISATLLEAFRLYTATDWFDEPKLLDWIKGTVIQTPQMKIGRSFHALLEHPQLNLSGMYEHGGLSFDPAAIDSILERLPKGGVFETKVAKSIGKTREEDDLVLVAKADYIAGLHVAEFKAPLNGQFDADKYERSVQWKMYSWLYGANRVTYHIACLYEQKDGLFSLRECSSMDLFPYPELERDVRELVREFLHYLRSRQLDSYLRKEVSAL